MARLLSLPIRAPRTTLALLFAITAWLAFYASRIQVDSSFENLLAVHDPERVYYEEIRDEFGSDQATQIALFADDVFAPGVLARLDTLTTKLETIEGVHEVISITNVKGVEPTDFGIRIGRFMRELPDTPEKAAAFKKSVLDNPLYVGNFVAADTRAASVLVFFEPMSEEEFQQRGIAMQVKAALDEIGEPQSLALTGFQTIKVQVAHLMKQDLLRFVPLSIALVVFVLSWQFRTFRGVLLPLASVLIALVWTLGAMVLAGSAINMGTLILPPLLLAVGIAYTTHLIARYYQELQHGRTRAAVVGATMNEARLPLSAAAVTTVLGFASLTISPITAIRELGIYSVFGILAVFFLALTFIPAALLVMPDIRSRPHTGEMRYSRIAARIERISRFAIERRTLIFSLTALLCLGCLWESRKLQVNTDYVEFFAPGSGVRKDHDRIAATLKGTHPVYFLIEGGGARSIAQLDTVEAIREIQAFIASQPGVGAALAISDFVHLGQKALNPDDPAGWPATQAELSQLLLLLSPADVKPVVNKDYSRANILVKTNLSASADVQSLIERVQEFAQPRLPAGMRVRATGIVVLLNRSADALSHGEIAGLVQLVVVLLVLLSMLFLSVRAGILCLVPNVVPVIILFGVMGWSGIPLDFSTSMIAVIAIGIAVDATIHYLTAFNDEVHATGSQEAAIANVSRHVGRPIAFTAGSLAAGFLTICLSNFRPIQHFGLLASFTMLVALASHLLLMPALVMMTRIITLWDLLYVKLGPRPHEEIPLFNGLRPFQARIVVLMARLASAGPGAHLTRRGETQPELYVLISGSVGIYRREGEELLRTCVRGDVIGEMGLVRDMPRSADSIAAEPTEYLVLDRAFLDRIRRRYPHIAARLFLNLSRTLSDRLETTTEMLVRQEPRAASAG